MSPEEAYAAAVETVRTSIEKTADVTWNGGRLSGDDPVAEALEAAGDERTYERGARWPDDRLYVDGAVLPRDIIRAVCASLRASGYVVVPGKPTEARLYEIGGEISRMIEGRVDDLDMAMALYLEVISGAPAFPPEAA